jgi:hypothetical protein
MDDAEVRARVEILDLFARYQQRVDSGAEERGLEELFTKDGSMHGLLGSATGTDGLRSFFRTSNREPEYEPYVGGRHNFFLPLITVDGDRARARCNMVVVVPGEPYGSVGLVMRYDDELAKEDGAWKFASRVCRMADDQEGLES